VVWCSQSTQQHKIMAARDVVCFPRRNQ
jgi:hypothetical protein